jgi:tetratricopeptide (TPR) repeat protein
MSNPWDTEEPTDKELWDELGDTVDARRQEIYFMLGARSFEKTKHDNALALFEQSLELCEKLSYTREKYFTLMWIARCNTELKNWDKVSDIFAKIEESAVPELEPDDLAQMFRTKAFAMRERRRAHEAIDAFQLAENYSRDNGDHFYTCMDAVQRAKVHALLREFSVAKEILLTTLDYAREHGMTAIAAGTQFTLGKVFLESGEIGAAIATLQDAVTCLEASKDFHHLNDAKLALGTAFVRAGDFVAAEAIFTPLEAGLHPWEAEIRASIVLNRAEMTFDPSEIATLHKQARALAINEGAYHFVNVIDINIAVVMAESGDLAGAEKILRDAITSAERFDDQDIINEARVRLASILVETDRSDEAISLLETMSIATFGDDTFGWQRYALVRSAAALCVGDIDDAEETVRVIMSLDRNWSNLSMIAEAYWITSQVEEHRNGRTTTWEHMLSASVAMTLQVGNTALATERSRQLVPDAPQTEGSDAIRAIPRRPITSPGGLIDDINSENGE